MWLPVLVTHCSALMLSYFTLLKNVHIFLFFFPHRSYFSSDSYYCSTFDFLINLPYLKCFTTPFLSGIFWLSHVMLSLFPGDNQPLKKKRKRYIMWINYSLTTGKDLKNQCVSHSRYQHRKDHKCFYIFSVQQDCVQKKTANQKYVFTHFSGGSQ